MKNTFKSRLGSFRFYYLLYMACFFLLLNVAVRVILKLSFADTLPLSISILPGILLGALNDLAALVYVLLLPATLILLPTDKFLRRKTGAIYTFVILFLYTGIFIFSSFSEFFFWQEFSSRFNFIAVDYLIYTTELTRNMFESYPMFWIFGAIAVFSFISSYFIFKRVKLSSKHFFVLTGSKTKIKSLWKTRILALISFYAFAGLLFLFFSPFKLGDNRYWNEYAKNGIYEIFSAARNNQLDYKDFYKSIDTKLAFSIMHSEILDANPEFKAPEGGNLLRVTAGSYRNSDRKPNVVIVVMESMGIKWLDKSPNLAALGAQGLSFTRLMSTGTRTVRGLEAVMLSIPPTPGESIVRRADNDKLFTLGSIFKERGYDLKFIYGGIGFFDNMNAFFSGNGYGIVDKLSFSAKNKTFDTAWGQCDEDLFAESLDQADKVHADEKPFHQVLLTTSNHRPFTYPGGKINIKSGSSRTGAVVYSDYAIGKYMEEARKKPWFDNTIFVFVGDHPSAIAGKTELPPNGYGIVCLMYGPKFFKPQRIDTLCSQLDIGPTLVAKIGWEYKSQFFGTDVSKLKPEAGRAWISTYQLLGFRTNNKLVILKPDKSAKVYPITAADNNDKNASAEPQNATASGNSAASGNSGNSAGSGNSARPGDSGNAEASVSSPVNLSGPFATANSTANAAGNATGNSTANATGEPMETNEELINRAIASYQTAYDLFVDKQLKESVVESYTPTLAK